MPTDLPRRRTLIRLQIPKPPQHRRLRDPRRPHHRRYPTTTSRTRLRRSPQPPTPLIQHTLFAQQAIPLSNPTLIDHHQPVLHNQQNTFKNYVVTPDYLVWVPYTDLDESQSFKALVHIERVVENEWRVRKVEQIPA